MTEYPKDKKPPTSPPALPSTLTVDLGGGVKMEFVLIPKGKFLMGSPANEPERNPFAKDFDAERQHEVEISKPFCLGKYPVTQQQYQALVKENPSWFQAGKGGADAVKGLDTADFPVEKVSWYDAQAFCQKMHEHDQQGRQFRLPTEAEWEYACRATTTTPFCFGSQLNGNEANCDGNLLPYGTTDPGPSTERTTKVGDYGANPWGLCDMHGNVWQWCADYYGPYNDDLKATDPLRSGRYSEWHRVLRGGSWNSRALRCRAAYRNKDGPDSRQSTIGFRVAFRLD